MEIHVGCPNFILLRNEVPGCQQRTTGDGTSSVPVDAAMCAGPSDNPGSPARCIAASGVHRTQTPLACSRSPYGGQDGANEPDQLIQHV
jgi:hypothetical protein